MYGYNSPIPGSACVIGTWVAFSDPVSSFIDFTRISGKWAVSKTVSKLPSLFSLDNKWVLNDVSSSLNIYWNLNLIKRYLKLEEWVLIVWSIVRSKKL